jgi:urate oxidase
MGIRLGRNNYGKSRVRLLRVARGPERNEIKELTLAIRFQGDFETVHTRGDNTAVLPTDTMKNTVYALARQQPLSSVEAFSQQLIKHFLDTCPEASCVEVDAKEDLWARIDSHGKPHATAFVRAGEEKRTAALSGTREKMTIRGGVENLVAMKTSTLPETCDRILATSIKADWLYAAASLDFDKMWEGVRTTLLETFAAHDSLSLQHTLYAMGEAVLARFGELCNIRLSLPNKHYNLVNLAPFGLENPAEVFLPIDEPHGLIEGTAERT